jgi:Terminase large subunit, T4likevirus-type, N-terminal
MSNLQKAAHQIDPALWVQQVVGRDPAAWQQQFLRACRGASILALTARQVGKTTTAAWAIAHHMMHYPNSLSVVVCPAQRQSGEAVRRVRETLIAAQAEFNTDNTYGLELTNRSRVLALPGSDDSIRGLSVDGWIIADEAARLSSDLIAAVRPMRARHPQTRLAMLSTAWSRTDPFWQAWDSANDDWMRLQVTVDCPDCPLSPQHLAQEKAALSEDDYKREYLGIPAGTHTSPFTWELYAQASRIFSPQVAPGPAFGPQLEAPGVPIANPFRKFAP